MKACVSILVHACVRIYLCTYVSVYAMDIVPGLEVNCNVIFPDIKERYLLLNVV